MKDQADKSWIKEPIKLTQKEIRDDFSRRLQAGEARQEESANVVGICILGMLALIVLSILTGA